MTDSEIAEKAERAEIEPLRDGEKRVIPPKQYAQGSYGLETRRDPQFSSLMFFSENPLDEVHKAMTREAPDDDLEYEAWISLYGAISGSVAKCHLAEEKSVLSDGSRGYTMLIVANYATTKGFQRTRPRPNDGTRLYIRRGI